MTWTGNRFSSSGSGIIARVEVNNNNLIVNRNNLLTVADIRAQFPLEWGTARYRAGWGKPMASMRDRFHVLAAAWLAALISTAAAADPIISPGAPITNNADVPTYLTDGSYLFGITVPSFDAGEFLLPIDIAGTNNLQSWQFTLSFDNAVVNEVDPGDGSAGIYGAEFTPDDPNTLSFILSGFPFNSSGTVDTIAGSYPSLPSGPSSDGPLAFILFEFLPGQAGNNPNFMIQDAATQELQVPEPGTLALLVCMLVLFAGQVRLGRGRKAI
jgi:hypothetical protein